MESNGKVIAVTGSRGALAPFVIGALGTAGFRVATDENFRRDLSFADSGKELTRQWLESFGRIDSVIALTGKYNKGNASDALAPVLLHSSLHANLLTVVNVISPLLSELKAREGHVVAMGSASPHQPKEIAYRTAKAALDAYMGILSLDEPLVHVALIAPDGPIDTDEKRSELANYIVSLVSHSHETVGDHA